MPDSSQSSPTPTPAPLSTPAGTENTNVSASPWRAGPEAPVWARGKTADEIMAITGNLMDAVVRPNAPTPTPTTPGAIDPTAYATGQDILNAQQQAVNQFAPALQRLAEQNATSTHRMVATDPRFAEVFQKYGPEVSQYLARVPKEQWTVDIVEGAAKLVRADHLDELARDRANQIVQSMEPTIRPTGGGSTSQAPKPELSLNSEKIPSDWRERAKKVGLDERTLDEFCYANGMSREQFFKQFDRDLIVEVGKVKGV